jgi:uncharacterized protein with PIN domain
MREESIEKIIEQAKIRRHKCPYCNGLLFLSSREYIRFDYRNNTETVTTRKNVLKCSNCKKAWRKLGRPWMETHYDEIPKGKK